MAILNRDNFLIWEGSFANQPIVVQANPDGVDVPVGSDSVGFSPFINDVATYGINYNSFEFVTQPNPAKPAIYLPSYKQVGFYLPANHNVGDVFTMQYRFRDTLGNLSNTGTITFTIIDRVSLWRPVLSSLRCEVTTGGNTGRAIYNTLERYYTDTNEPYSPAQTKLNAVGSPDYVAPFENLAACPLPIESVPFYISNYANSLFFVIERIVFGNQNYILSLSISDLSPMQIQVPKSFVGIITVFVSSAINPGNKTLTWELRPGTAGGSAVQVKTTLAQQSFSFDSATLGDTFGGELILTS